MYYLGARVAVCLIHGIWGRGAGSALLLKDTGDSEAESLCYLLQKSLLHSDKDCLLDQTLSQTLLSPFSVMLCFWS